MEEFKIKENENPPPETLEKEEVEKLRGKIAELKKEAEDKKKENEKRGKGDDYCLNVELLDVNPDELSEKDLLLFKKLKDGTLTFKNISEHRAKEVGPFIMEKLSQIKEEKGLDSGIIGEEVEYSQVVLKNSRPAFLGWIGARWAAEEAGKRLKERHRRKAA
jgi:hypothetical protein